MNKSFIIALLFLVTIGATYYGCQKATIYDKTSIEKVDAVKAINICSFNIQFLGHFKKRDNHTLAHLLKDFDIVVIQEMVSPPVDGIYPDNTNYTADVESIAFVDQMTANGFEYKLSEEDTGPGEEIHIQTSATEWFITFYKDEILDYVDDLPNGFLAEDRSNNPDFERVPYAFPFRVKGTETDFVLISVHLAPNKSEADRRKHELASIANWIDDNDQQENDFIILGDMNIEDTVELKDALPIGFVSLNNEGYRTNTLINENANQGAKPYDHVLYKPANTSDEIDEEFDIVILDLIYLMEDYWTSSEVYPGNPYDHNLFKQYYSDHHPIVFRIKY